MSNEHGEQNRPISVTICRQIRVRLAQLGWSQKDLAKEIGVSEFQISRVMNGAKLDQDLFAQIMRALGRDYYWFVEVESKGPDLADAWNARYGQPKVLFDVFRVHQQKLNEIVSFDQHLVCSQMPKRPHDKRYNAQLSEMLWRPEGSRMLKTFIEFADMRRERYLAKLGADALHVTSIVPRSELDLILHRKFPYDDPRFHASDSFETFDYLIEECITKRGLSFHLLPEAAIEDQPLLQRVVREADSLAVVGRSLMVRRHLDFNVVWDEHESEVEQALWMHGQLLKYIERYSKRMNLPPAIATLAEYREKARAMAKQDSRDPSPERMR